MAHPLIDEAGKKAAIAWLDGRAVWCAWFDGALYVVAAGRPSRISGTLVTGRDRHPARRPRRPGRLLAGGGSRVEPGSEEWDHVAPQLAGKRLNASGGADEVVARWASGCALYALRPGDAPAVTGADLPSGSLAEPPRPTSATRPARRPFRLHRVRRP